MCIVFLSFNDDPSPGGYKLILAANRDEFYKRPTAPADFWEQHPNIIGGLDLLSGKEGGTWLGFTKSGRFGCLTNYRQSLENYASHKDAIGRGFLVSDFLKDDISTSDYLRNIQQNGSKYNGFNLLVGELCSDSESKIEWYCNCEDKQIKTLSSGNYALCNRTLNFPWPKVVHGQKRFEDILQKSMDKQALLDGLLGLLQENQRYFPGEDDSNYCTLLDKELDQDYKDACRSIFVQHNEIGYGTRTHTVILVDEAGHVTYMEKTMDSDQSDVKPSNRTWTENTFEFDLLTT
ncbi:predicted protein [Nematostella vectensis]|uniref:Transport and Golgi organization protein 2 homolog n=2 Tax=Nematostella vectensis TaxID=45351 RepID=A7SAI6_NEMVE|nr:transport and Golgi organization 2 homolog isoform X2 [Nematostella vectensis]XP_048583139.1 transport and Golgi organization 2 homolog isoform X2 [Nematostella vectensis]XP_048583140.1 transport and Golgi organization 2 homolog isoform X2 [Nematostella vectensis]EDO39284.1 predicted protein [Nematostella vectensis]|eukprot:XP_001631347.1 predicted protein [Nematostella vectensis]